MIATTKGRISTAGPHRGFDPSPIRAELKVDRHAFQRSHHLADDDADHERQEKGSGSRGAQRSQRGLVRDFVADRRLLANLAKASIIALIRNRQGTSLATVLPSGVSAQNQALRRRAARRSRLPSRDGGLDPPWRSRDLVGVRKRRCSQAAVWRELSS